LPIPTGGEVALQLGDLGDPTIQGMISVLPQLGKVSTLFACVSSAFPFRLETSSTVSVLRKSP
jgi:hypothetical protein